MAQFTSYTQALNVVARALIAQAREMAQDTQEFGAYGATADDVYGAAQELARAHIADAICESIEDLQRAAQAQAQRVAQLQQRLADVCTLAQQCKDGEQHNSADWARYSAVEKLLRNAQQLAQS